MREQNNDDSNEENCPLTLSDWVMFLNGEISNAKMYTLGFGTTVIASLAVLGGMIAILISASKYFKVWLIGVGVVVALIFLRVHSKYQNRINNLNTVRHEIIYGNLTDSNEIRKRCEEKGVFR
ncbi:hypothetical protein FHEFKHOI_00067 [Candidatus Methanoperedenaceae archaeon GB50]|nr:hypothetical protein FHEFKHOI_00067 [Candidatus Methanoperedenaceae archaeon GB50]